MSIQTFPSILLFVSFLARVSAMATVTFDCRDAAQAFAAAPEGPVSSSCKISYNVAGFAQGITRNLQVQRGMSTTLWVLNEKDQADAADPSFDSHVDVLTHDLAKVIASANPILVVKDCNYCYEGKHDCYLFPHYLNDQGYALNWNNEPSSSLLVCNLKTERIATIPGFSAAMPYQAEDAVKQDACPDAKIELRTIAGANEDSGHLALTYLPDCNKQFRLAGGRGRTSPVIAIVCRYPEVKYEMVTPKDVEASDAHAAIAGKFSDLVCSSAEGKKGHFVLQLEENGQEYRLRNRNRIRV